MIQRIEVKHFPFFSTAWSDQGIISLISIMPGAARQHQNARTVPLLNKVFGNARLRQQAKFETGTRMACRDADAQSVSDPLETYAVAIAGRRGAPAEKNAASYKFLYIDSDGRSEAC